MAQPTDPHPSQQAGVGSDIDPTTEPPSQADRSRRIDSLEQRLSARIWELEAEQHHRMHALQRAFDHQIDETDARIRRSRWMAALIGITTLFTLAGTLWIGARQSEALRREIDRLQGDLDRLAEARIGGQLLEERLARLTTMAATISQSLRSLDTRSAAEIRKAQARWEERAQGLRRQLDALQVAQRTLAGRVRDLQRPVQQGAPPTEVPELGTTEARTPPETSPIVPPEKTLASDLPAEPPPQEPDAPSEGVKQRVTEPEPQSPPEPDGQAREQPPEPAPDPDTEGPSIVLDTPRFGLQIIGFFRLDRLRAFVDRDDLPQPLYYLRGRFRGRPWYTLIQSLHPDRRSAREARAQLPEDLAKLDIWIRLLGAGTRLYALKPESGDQTSP